MKKTEFIKKLNSYLGHLPEAEKKEISSDYEEYFITGAESGRPEEEIVKSLGDPVSIARQLRADYYIKNANEKISATEILRAIFATAGLGFFNLIFILGPFIGIVGVFFSLCIGAIGVFASGFVGVIASIVAIIDIDYVSHFVFVGLNPIAAIFISIGIVGVGILMIIFCSYMAKWLYQLTISYLKFNLRIINGKEAIK